MSYRAPVGSPEAVVLGCMPYRRPMTVAEILRAGPFHRKSGYRPLKVVLERLVDAGRLERTIRKPRTGRPAVCYRRIAALPR